MIVSTSHKFVFCSVPKVASRALRDLFEPLADEVLMKQMFRNLRNQHGMLPSREPNKIREKMIQAGEDPGSYYWFGFLRNPWDRAVSRYMFEHERAKIGGVLGRISKGALAYHKRMIGLEWGEYLRAAPYDPQSKWMSDPSGVVVERIFRIEDMPDALHEIGERIGVSLATPGKRGETKRDRDYRTYFEDEDQVRVVANHYLLDILLGGYSYSGHHSDSYNLKRLISATG